MERLLKVLERVRIAAPCRVPWASMQGDDRVRFCGQCDKHVFNLSNKDQRDALGLIVQMEGKMCVALYRRQDGTTLTSNCPVGLHNLRRRVAGLASGLVAVFALMVGATTVLGHPWRKLGLTRLGRMKPVATLRGVLASARDWLMPPEHSSNDNLTLGGGSVDEETMKEVMEVYSEMIELEQLKKDSGIGAK